MLMLHNCLLPWRCNPLLDTGLLRFVGV